MIRTFDSKTTFKEQIISLWKDCFGDTEDYISFFLNNCPGFVGIGYFIDEKLVSMFFLLEGSINGRKCKYLYAACTDKKFRKQGIMEQLIHFAEEYCIENGYHGIFLVPADEKLYSYYAKFGFISSFQKVKSYLSLKDVTESSPSESSDIEMICKIKENLLCNIKGFRFSYDVIEYTVREHLFNGGYISYLNEPENQAIAFYFTEKNDIFVKELLSDQIQETHLITKLFSNKNAENIYILSPVVYNSTDIGEEYTKCGMCLPLNIEFRNYLLSNNKLYAGMYLD